MKLTKEELRDKFKAFQLGNGDFDMTRGLDGSYESLHTQIAWISWVECARELGALE